MLASVQHSWSFLDFLSNWSWQEGTGEVGEASQYRLEMGVCLQLVMPFMP